MNLNEFIDISNKLLSKLSLEDRQYLLFFGRYLRKKSEKEHELLLNSFFKLLRKNKNKSKYSLETKNEKEFVKDSELLKEIKKSRFDIYDENKRRFNIGNEGIKNLNRDISSKPN